MSNRVNREKDAYDSGEVFQESARLQQRFWHVFECPNTKAADQYYKNKIMKICSNAKVLDYGCYKGDETKKILQFKPKEVFGIDISERAIQSARENYNHLAEFHVMDAHQLTFPENTFDAVIGRSILHHLEFEKAILELERVLKPGGTAVFIEPLDDNPLGKLARKMTPKARTRDEKPLSRKQLNWADKQFRRNRHLFYNLFSVPIACLTSLTMSHPNNMLLKLSHFVDLKLATSPLRYWMRSVVLVWEK